MKYLLALILGAGLLYFVIYIIEKVPQQSNWVISAISIFFIGILTIFGGGRI